MLEFIATTSARISALFAFFYLYPTFFLWVFDGEISYGMDSFLLFCLFFLACPVWHYSGKYYRKLIN